MGRQEITTESGGGRRERSNGILATQQGVKRHFLRKTGP